MKKKIELAEHFLNQTFGIERMTASTLSSLMQTHHCHGKHT